MTNLRHITAVLVIGALSGTLGAASAQSPIEPLTLAEALALVEATETAAAEKDLRLSIAVVDGRGDPIAVVRLPGARPSTTDTAIGKAMVSAMTGRPSAATIGQGQNALYQNLNDNTRGRLRFFQGAVPIVRGGYTVGAIGASGASAQDDEDAVTAALRAVGIR
jgi:glc operon protein GlcG